MTRKIAILCICVAVLFAAAVFVLYWYRHQVQQPPSQLSAAAIQAQLTNENSAFAAAVQSEDAGNYSAATAQLQTALTTANDGQEQDLIEGRLAEDAQAGGDVGT